VVGGGGLVVRDDLVVPVLTDVTVPVDLLLGGVP
jgi:hypothetical protein